MKWNAWILVCGVAATAMVSGCGSKDQQQVASTASPASSSAAAPSSSPPASGTSAPSSTAAKPSAPASSSGSASPPIANDDSGSEPAAQPPTSKPSRPSIGGMGLPGANATVPPNVAASPSRPSLGSSSGAAASPPSTPPGGPSRPGLGSTGGAAPTSPPPGTLAGTDSSNFAAGGNTSAPVMAPIELSLRDRAVNAFKAGNTPRAYALFQAHTLSVPNDEIESLMGNFRWDKKRIVPRFGYSFAVGLIVNKTGNVDELKPIGTSLEALRGSAAGAGGRPGGGPGFGGAGGRPGGSANASGATLPAKELSDAAGTFASKFVEAFSKVHADGKWSEAFREYELGSSGTVPSGLGGGAGGFAGALGGFGGASPGASGPGGPPPGYGGAGGPPAGYAGGAGGPPPGYGGGQGGPPAGYSGGPGAGAPPGYGAGQGGPPAGYRGGANAGAPPGYGGNQGGPPEGYRGGANAGAPPGYGGGGSAPSGAPPAGQPPAGQGGAGNSGSSSPDKVEYVAPQDDALSPGVPGAGANVGAGANLGAGARPGFGAPGGRPGFGAPGGGQPPANAPGSGFANAAAAAGLDPALLKDMQLPSGTIPLGPGLNYIGTGENVGELSKLANEGHYDALIVFEVDASFLRVNNTVKNDCRIRVINLRADKDSKDKAITSSSLNNRDVASDKDPEGKVDNAVDVLLKKMFDAYPLDDLPKFTGESIQKKRLGDLVNDKKRSPLDLLAEIELYASKGLIDDTLKLEAFEKIAGPDGRVLATGTPEEKLPIVEKMVRRKFD